MGYQTGFVVTDYFFHAAGAQDPMWDDLANEDYGQVFVVMEDPDNQGAGPLVPINSASTFIATPTSAGSTGCAGSRSVHIGCIGHISDE